MDQNVALVIRRYNLSLLRQFAKRKANLNVRTAAMKNMPIIPNWKRSEDQTTLVFMKKKSVLCSGLLGLSPSTCSTPHLWAHCDLCLPPLSCHRMKWIIWTKVRNSHVLPMFFTFLPRFHSVFFSWASANLNFHPDRSTSPHLFASRAPIDDLPASSRFFQYLHQPHPGATYRMHIPRLRCQ